MNEVEDECFIEDDIISFANVPLTDDLLEEITNKIDSMPSISSICLHNCGLTCETVETLLSHVKEPSLLFELDFSSNNFGSGIVESIYKFPISVSTLNLDSTGLTDDGLISLMQHCSDITILSLQNNLITSKSAIVFFSSNIELVSLNLSGNKIDDAAIFSIKPFIKQIDLSNNSFSPSGLRLLCSTFQQGRVKGLNLSGMKFGSAISSIPNLIQSSIKKLILRDCGITHFPDISETKLKLLDLSGNSVCEFEHPESVTVVANMILSKNKKRTKIEFPEFQKMRQQIEDLQEIGEVLDEDGSTSLYLQEINKRIQSLSKKLASFKHKLNIKPTRKSLVLYASKASDSFDFERDISEFYKSGITGHKITSDLSNPTKIQIYVQFSHFLIRLQEKSLYLDSFRPESFVWTDENRLILIDPSLITNKKNKLVMNSMIEFLFGGRGNELNFLKELSGMMTRNVLVKQSEHFEYEITRESHSVIDLFSKITPNEIVAPIRLIIKDESAVDHGGVLRDVMSQFWQDISISHFEMSDKAVTLLPKAVNHEDFFVIGKIAAKCLIENIPLAIPIHSFVFRFLCYQLPKTKEEWVDSIFEFDPQLGENIGFDALDDSEVVARCYEVLFERRKKELESFVKGFTIIPMIKFLLNQAINWWELSKMIVGETECTNQAIIDQIKFIGFKPNSKTTKLWFDVINSFSEGEARKFLRLITGLNSIPAGGFVSRGKNLIITKSNRFYSHTCTFELESPKFKSIDDLMESIQVAFKVIDTDGKMDEWHRDLT